MKRFLAISALSVSLVAGTARGFANDWPCWRGPEQSGLTRENAAVTSWSPDGQNVLWHKNFGGRTTPIVSKGRVFFNAPLGEGVGLRERVLCLDADTGDILWERRFNVFHTDIVGNRVGWTAVVVDPESDNVYCHGTGGELFCWDRDGRLIWKHSLTEEFGRISGYGGRLMNPIIDEDRVVLSFLNSSWGDQARGRHRYVAFDKRDGTVLWWSETDHPPLDTTYATPVVAVIGGRRMLIAPAADGWVYGMLARTGEKVWSYRLSKRGLNASPVVDGNYVYVGHSEENYTTTEMGAMVCIDASKAGDITDDGAVWRIDGMTVGYCSPAIADGRLYVVTNDANLFAIDAKDGRVYWEYSIGRVGKGSPVVTADRVIYVGEQNGIFHILKDEGDQCVSLDREQFEGPGAALDEFFGSPAVANGRVYFMTRYNTFCLGGATSSQNVPVPQAAAETPQEGATVSECLISPAEITVSPAENVRFTLHGFYSDGRPAVRFSSQKPQWEVAGLAGTVSSGTFTAADDGRYSAGLVRVKWIDDEAAARLRIVPELPIEVTFDDMEPGGVPPGWIAAAARVKVAELDGEKVLQKITTRQRPSPPFMRLRTYVTPVIEGGCTVQCDMMSRQFAKNQWITYLPEMGLINTRYRFIMMGMNQALRIESWSPMPRLRKDVKFEWQPDTWYTARFQVEPIEGGALCRAKVWPRDQEEPDAWQIDVLDPYPNVEGSAGLYCYSVGTTADSDGPQTYFDNLKVYRDE
jgi:outer membrane protein assembly factor BamB